MFKVMIISTTVLVGAVWWGIGSFLSLMLYLWPIPIQATVNPVPVQDVQLGTTVQQATPSKLQDSVNVMGE